MIVPPAERYELCLFLAMQSALPANATYPARSERSDPALSLRVDSLQAGWAHNAQGLSPWTAQGCLLRSGIRVELVRPRRCQVRICPEMRRDHAYVAVYWKISGAQEARGTVLLPRNRDHAHPF